VWWVELLVDSSDLMMVEWSVDYSDVYWADYWDG